MPLTELSRLIRHGLEVVRVEMSNWKEVSLQVSSNRNSSEPLACGKDVLVVSTIANTFFMRR